MIDGEDIPTTTGKKFSLRGAWDNSYSFVQPKLNRLVKPAIYLTLTTAAVLGIEHREEVKGFVAPETPKIKGTLINDPRDLEFKTIPIDETGGIWLPAVKEADVLICKTVTANGSDCEAATFYFSEDDLKQKKVGIEGKNITANQSLFEANQTRPWIRVTNKER